MADVYSTVFGRFSLSDVGLHVLRPPAGFRWVLVCVDAVMLPSVVGGELQLLLPSTDGTGTLPAIILPCPVAQQASGARPVQWTGRQVIDAGEELTFAWTGAATAGQTVSLTGYQLTLP